MTYVMPAKVEQYAEQLGALGSPVRLSILRALVQGRSDGTAV
jgi:DNA-binding transcriptional ArsR family regulator